MTKKFQPLSTNPTTESKESIAHIGFAVKLMSKSPSHARLSAAHISGSFDAAFRHRQLRYFFNGEGEPVGFVAWAKITIDVQRKMMKTASWNLHKSEWNEGEILWIVDFLALFGNLNSILEVLRDEVFTNFSSVRYIRFKNNKAIFKEITREDFSRFMRSGAKSFGRI